MVEQQADNQLQFLLSDLSTRIREIEERNSSIKEKMNVVSQNMIDSRQELQERLSQVEKQNFKIVADIKKMNSILADISSEMANFVRKDEIILVERMLKDFQPLEFMRKKDVEEMIIELESKLNPKNLHLTIESNDDVEEEQPIKTRKSIK